MGNRKREGERRQKGRWEGSKERQKGRERRLNIIPSFASHRVPPNPSGQLQMKSFSPTREHGACSKQGFFFSQTNVVQFSPNQLSMHLEKESRYLK